LEDPEPARWLIGNKRTLWCWRATAIVLLHCRKWHSYNTGCLLSGPPFDPAKRPLTNQPRYLTEPGGAYAPIDRTVRSRGTKRGSAGCEWRIASRRLPNSTGEPSNALMRLGWQPSQGTTRFVAVPTARERQCEHRPSSQRDGSDSKAQHPPLVTPAPT